MKTNLIPPPAENSSKPLNAETRPPHANAVLALPASADFSETNVESVCDKARFGPFGFRINVKPGRSSRLTCRVLRKNGAAGHLRAATHI